LFSHALSGFVCDSVSCAVAAAAPLVVCAKYNGEVLNVVGAQCNLYAALQRQRRQQKQKQLRA